MTSLRPNDALAKLAWVTDALQALDLPYVELTPPEFQSTFAVGAAVRLDDGFVIVSVPVAGEMEVFVTGGALRDVPHDDKLGVLTVCNDLTSGWSTPCCYLHDAEDTWSILVQQRFPLPIVRDVPPYFRAMLDFTAANTVVARQSFAEHGIGGQPWEWDAPSLQRLLTKSVF